MSNSEEEEEEEGEGERGMEEDEEFYESLDRILSSSSCSSASASDDDGDYQHRNLHRRYGRRAQKLPAAAMYDVWMSEPASVEERRRHLLRQMGLIGDPSVSRRKQPGQGDGDGEEGGDDDDQAAGLEPGRLSEMGRSVSCDGLCRQQDSSSCAIARSRSDGAVNPNSAGLVHRQHPPNKPPVARSPSSGGNANDSHDSDVGREDSLEDGEHPDRHCDLYCTIKNLDNGVEFVVKELREDGMWNKLREVGTGRQLTMEEFQSSVIGHSPIVQELMRRQNVEAAGGGSGKREGSRAVDSGPAVNGLKTKKKGSWLKSIKNVAGTVVQRMERRSSDERDTSSEKGGRRSSSATDDSQDAQSQHGPERVKVRHYGKSWKEFSGLYMSQEIRAHNGSIWSIKFSLDGRYLASAGEDCVIHIWQVMEMERKGDLLTERGAGAPSAEDVSSHPFSAFSNGSPEPLLLLSNFDTNNVDKKRRAKVPATRKSFSFDQIVMPENVFALSEKPVCSFLGHLEDVLDLSWSKSQHLLSSSMDKTVRLWHMSSNDCLKIFSHSDYVTCIQFNPVDDDYFISGSLDDKVRIWSIRHRQVVDWKDVHEMVTAACYTPDGQGALVGSNKGGCHFYDTSENKLHLKCQIDLQNKKKKSHHKKITGFQFVPGSSSEVLITSADSRIRVVDGLELVHKFKGFLNTSSQISASLTTDGKYVVCASEDSHVYVWRHDGNSRPNRSKGAVAATQSYEHFHCQDVSVAVAWPGASPRVPLQAHSNHKNEQAVLPNAKTKIFKKADGQEVASLHSNYDTVGNTQHRICPTENGNHFCDRTSATWPEEKLLLTVNKQSPQSGGDFSNGDMQMHSRLAWGMVIVTAGRGGEIRTFQNFGYSSRI
uniref:WD repeat-containing protein 44 n=1 Tax=Anthurium amnicola TaxID=1678845 RepID=A0A1D1XPG7_9ARAE